jgi:hypothetical protein
MTHDKTGGEFYAGIGGSLIGIGLAVVWIGTRNRAKLGTASGLEPRAVAGLPRARALRLGMRAEFLSVLETIETTQNLTKNRRSRMPFTNY